MPAPELDVSFLQELGKDKYKPVSRNIERKWIRDYQINDNLRSLQLLVNHNLRYIVDYVVKSGYIEMDLIQAAVLGFKRAVKKFDLKKKYAGKDTGIKLITYARHWMVYKIQEYKRQCQVVQVSHYAKYNAVTLNRITEGQEYASDDDVASQSGLTQARIDTAIKASRATVPFEVDKENLKASSNTPYEEAVANEELELENEQHSLIRGAIRLMPPDEAAVIRNRFLPRGGESLSYRHLGKILNCSHETVRKIERVGLDRLQGILCIE